MVYSSFPTEQLVTSKSEFHRDIGGSGYLQMGD
jgi:hypothetical protein